MKRRLWWIILLCLLGSATHGLGDDSARRFIAGIEAYKAGRYDVAIAQFSELTQSGLINAKLFYNLGNAYLKQDELGPAILWYERALRLAPDDPDLRFNLTYARSLAKDTPEVDDNTLVHIFFFWKFSLSDPTLRLLAVGCNLLLWVAAAAWYLTHYPGLKAVTIVALAATVIFSSTAGFNAYERMHWRQAVVLPASISVRSGLESHSTQLFELHAGAKVRVMRQMKAHYQIRYSDDKIGWVEKASIGVIE